MIGPLVSEGTFPLPPMKPAELDDAVVLPAARAGVFFDDGVVAAVVADAAASPAALPMMQFTLAELFERRVDGRVTTASLEALGGIAGAVGRAPNRSTVSSTRRAGPVRGNSLPGW